MKTDIHRPIINLKIHEKMSNIRTAAENLLHLHMCEQEGISSGQPTREQWLKAVEALETALSEPQEGKIYREVDVKDRLPEEGGYYIASSINGSDIGYQALEFDKDKKIWNGKHPIDVKCWLEPIEQGKVKAEANHIKEFLIKKFGIRSDGNFRNSNWEGNNGFNLKDLTELITEYCNL